MCLSFEDHKIPIFPHMFFDIWSLNNVQELEDFWQGQETVHRMKTNNFLAENNRKLEQNFFQSFQSEFIIFK